MNLIFSNGIYTSFLLYSVLKQNDNLNNNIFILYGKSLNVKLLEENKNIINKLFNTSNILIWQNYKKFLGIKTNNFINDINNNLQNNKIKNIYLPINSSTVRLHKILAKIFVNANFIFYEEGLFSYVKPIFNKKLYLLLQKGSCFFVGYNFLTTYLKYYFKNIKVNIINKDFLLNALNLIKVNSNNLSNEEGVKYCLVLPQYYYLSSKNKFAELINLYNQELRNLANLGYKIIIKEHPKAKHTISGFFKNAQVLSTNNPAIIEQLILNTKIDLAFSVYSSSLLSLNYLFNIPVVSSHLLLKQRINYFSFYPTLSAVLINNLLPKIKYGIIREEKGAVDIKNIYKTNSKLFNAIVSIKKININ